MKNDLKISADVKYVGKSSGLLVLVIILLIVTFNIGLKQVKEISKKLTTAKKTEKVLQEKFDILRTVESYIPSDTNFLDLALPEKNVALYALNIVKNNALNNLVLISNIRISGGAKTKEGYSKTTLSFDVEGEEQSVYNFMNSFTEVLPMMNIDKVDITAEGGSVFANLSLNVFSAEFPKKIPSVTTAINDFSDDEIKTLSEISRYKTPEFFIPKPALNQDRQDPFN